MRAVSLESKWWGMAWRHVDRMKHFKCVNVRQVTFRLGLGYYYAIPKNGHRAESEHLAAATKSNLADFAGIKGEYALRFNAILYVESQLTSNSQSKAWIRDRS
jgi:hypothetical protein